MHVTHNMPERQQGLLQAAELINWKREHGALHVPVAPLKVIISPQLNMVLAKKKLFSKKIKGLSGVHLCINPSKGIYLSGGWGTGAPALIAVCEELHALGAKEFYLTGVCGRLTDNMNEGETMIASKAIREEGTSQHYLPVPADRHIVCSYTVGMEKLAQTLHIKAGTFVTTDAPYRETAVKCDLWRTEGAHMIDMETSALYAFGNFYNIQTYAFGVAADSLAGNQWTMAKDYTHVQKQLSTLIDNLIEAISQ